MKLIQGILIVIAKFLIFIGDVTLFLLGLLWKPIKFVFDLILDAKNKLISLKKHKVVEKEIFSSESGFSKPYLPKTNLNFKRNFILPHLKFPDLVIPKVKTLRFSKPQIRLPGLPKFSLPKIHTPKIPTVNAPKISAPKISTPEIKKLEVSALKFTIPQPYYPAFPSLPHLNLAKNKKRGRPKLPIRIPYTARFKYLFAGALVSLIFFFLPLYAYTFIKSLPNPHALENQEIPQTTKIYDRNKILLYQIYANQNRTDVPLSKIPEHLKEATIAIEDKNFYTTPGFDIVGITRSAIADLSGKPLQGGSTITQQLIKARLLTPERTVERKIKEVALAVWAERIYTKDEILEMYFNQVPYGGTAWGAEAGAQTYFGKNVEDLTLAESSFLAGLPQAPSIYSPYSGNGDLWKSRQKDVLNQMVELKFITPEEAKKASETKLEFKPYRNNIKAPHFVMYVKDLLIEKYGLPVVERGGLTVITSLDLKAQDMAQKIISEEVEKSGHLNFTNGAALITNPQNGDILAMVGGRDYFDENGGNYNVTTALRQPGSTIKVITYSAALMNGQTAATSIQDSPVSFAAPGAPVYSPVNYDGRFHGTVTLRNALGNSINIPAVKLLNQVGVSNMMNLAKDMGITTWNEPKNYGLAITLGAAEVKMTDMAEVYGTLANSGNRVELNPLVKVTNYQGAVLEEKGDVRKKRVMPEEIAFIISNILSDNEARTMAFGTNSVLNIPKHTVSVKTGTTDNKRDNWTIGYTPNLLVAVWVGNNNNMPMNPLLASGITGAAPIWNKIMSNLLSTRDAKNEVYPLPSNIVTRSCGDKTEYFIKGTENKGFCRPISINDRQPNL